MSDEPSAMRRQRKIEELLARDLSTMGHEAQAHHARRIQRLKEARSHALAHTEVTIAQSDKKSSQTVPRSGSPQPDVPMS